MDEEGLGTKDKKDTTFIDMRMIDHRISCRLVLHPRMTFFSGLNDEGISRNSSTYQEQEKEMRIRLVGE